MSILSDYEKILNLEKRLNELRNSIIQDNKRLKIKVNMLLDKINKSTFLQRLKYLFTKRL